MDDVPCPALFIWKGCMAMKQELKKQVVQIQKTTLVLLLCVVFVLVVFCGVTVYRNIRISKTYGELDELASVVEENYYVDVDKHAVLQGAMKGYVAGLNDPYSQYMTDEEYESFLTEESGQMVGIGVTVTMTDDGYILVNAVNEGSPAEEAGVMEEDIIQQVDGADVAEMGYEAAIDAVKGKENTTVKLQILRQGDLVELDVKRKSMDVTTAQGTILEDQIGYIRISAFKENTPEQFMKVYQQMLDNGIKGFVFDVRDNGGGLVDSLEKILDPLLPEGDIAVATYRDGTTQTLVKSDAEESDLPMVVLVNENTASAAELFAASLQDFNKAKLVGVTTFGKGIMQVTSSMPSGGALTLTVATYQTTRGNCYHKIGINPDKQVQAGEEVIDYENPDVSNDPQLSAAIQLLQE